MSADLAGGSGGAGRRVVAVVGATGRQGGGLARAILDDPAGGVSCRALTRNPDSDAARALAERGAEVVRADLDDEASLRDAFAGTDAAFCMTNFFEHFDPERELAQGANLARAMQAAGVRHAVWSTSLDSREIVLPGGRRLAPLPGGYDVPHWDGKARANAFFADSGVPTTFVLMPMFWENLVTPGTPQFPHRGEDGMLAIALPADDVRHAGIAAEDIGRCVYAILRAGDELAGKTVGLAGELLTGARLVAGLTDVFGEPVRLEEVSVEAVRNAPFPGAAAVANMFQLVTEANDECCARYDVALTRSLHPGLRTYADWVATTRLR